MTPRENVRRAIEFDGPERLAVFGYGPADDRVGIAYEEILPEQARQAPGRVDQWLCAWEQTDQPNMGQVKGHPLENLAGMGDFPWPDGADPRRFDSTRKQLQELAGEPADGQKYRVSGIFLLLWERMQALHGFENCMIDLMDDTPAIHELAERITEYNVTLIRSLHAVCGEALDGIGFSEDWGTQLDLHISPELWTRFFLPRYERIFGAIHDCGYHVLMHSCGRINKALDGLIQAGCDVINMQQPRVNGIEEIGQSFAGRICFESLCDIQATLPGGDAEAIAAEAEALLKHWGRPEGGFILGDYGDAAAIGVRPEVKQDMLETFRRLDPWKRGERAFFTAPSSTGNASPL